MQNHPADSSLYVWLDVWSADLQVNKKYGKTWHRMSLLRPGVIKQHKPTSYFDIQQEQVARSHFADVIKC